MPNNTTLEQDETPATPAHGENFADILSQYEQSHSHKPEAGRQGFEGTVVAISAEYVFLDIGYKTEGVIPVGEFKDSSGSLSVKVGDQFPVTIKGRNEEGYYELSKVHVERPKDWSSLESAFNEKRSIAGVVSGVVKGGLSVDVGVRAFMPASRSGAKDAAELEKLVGQEIACRIIKLDVSDEDVVVDRRVVLEEEEAAARQKLFTDLKEGAVLHGAVRSLTDYGAFVDIGGVDGLLHVDALRDDQYEMEDDGLAWVGRRSGRRLRTGQQIRVVVTAVNPIEGLIDLDLAEDV